MKKLDTHFSKIFYTSILEEKPYIAMNLKVNHLLCVATPHILDSNSPFFKKLAIANIKRVCHTLKSEHWWFIQTHDYTIIIVH